MTVLYAIMLHVTCGEEIPEEQEFFNELELEHLADIRQMMAVWHFLLDFGMIILAAVHLTLMTGALYLLKRDVGSVDNSGEKE